MQKIKKGYKYVKGIGEIPEEWGVKKFGDIIDKLETGVSVNSEDRKKTKNEFGILKTSAVSYGYFIPQEYKTIFTKEVSRAKVNPKMNSIIISRMNTPELVGASAYIDRNYNDLFLPDRLWQTIIKKTITINVKWLYYVLNLNKFKCKLSNIATGTSNSMKNISKSAFLNINTPLPSFSEQQKIAQILSTWDNAIYKTEKLIEERKIQKKGLMQKLLSGEKRLKEFKNKEWKKIKLGEILKERKEIEYENLELLAITAKNGVVRRNVINIKDNSSKDKRKYKRILPMDIGYNTMRMWQGVCGVSKYEGIVSPAYTILKPTKKVNSIFIGYLFKLPLMINKFRRYSQGLVNDTLNLKYQNFKEIKCSIPINIDEQRAIANILTTADKEINLLNEKLETLKQQKKGLMQNLLTGKVRVKI